MDKDLFKETDVQDSAERTPTDDLWNVYDNVYMVSDVDTLDETLTDVDADGYYDSSAMKTYLAKIGKIPLLIAEEELELGRIIAENGPEAPMAREKLIVSNLRLVVHYAKRYVKEGLSIEDINAMGIEGLIKAVSKYDYTLGYRFSTYASNWIKQSILRRMNEESGPVRIPTYISENLARIKKAQKELESSNGREPTVCEIAEMTGLSESAVIKALDTMYNVVSLDARISEDGETTHLDTIADEASADLSTDMISVEFRELIASVLGQLNEREAMVLKLRYGIGTGQEMTLEDIARLPEFHVSRERIRQIEARALMKIRHNPKMMKALMDYRTA